VGLQRTVPEITGVALPTSALATATKAHNGARITTWAASSEHHPTAPPPPCELTPCPTQQTAYGTCPTSLPSASSKHLPSQTQSENLHQFSANSFQQTTGNNELSQLSHLQPPPLPLPVKRRVTLPPPPPLQPYQRPLLPVHPPLPQPLHRFGSPVPSLPSLPPYSQCTKPLTCSPSSIQHSPCPQPLQTPSPPPDIFLPSTTTSPEHPPLPQPPGAPPLPGLQLGHGSATAISGGSGRCMHAR
jgi:hypothetical protein